MTTDEKHPPPSPIYMPYDRGYEPVRVKICSMKVSSRTGSLSRPSSSAGSRGKYRVKARANSPTPFFSVMPFGVYTLTCMRPQLGDLLLKINPQRFSASSSRTRFSAQLSMRSVWSMPVQAVTRRGASGLPTRRIVSLGAEKPDSTSGQTGTKSRYWPSVSVR